MSVRTRSSAHTFVGQGACSQAEVSPTRTSLLSNAQWHGQTSIQSGTTGIQTSCHRFTYSTLESSFIWFRIKSETNMECREGPPAWRQERNKPWSQLQRTKLIPSATLPDETVAHQEHNCSDVNNHRIGHVWPHHVHTGQILNSFGSVSDDEVLQLINKMPSKSSPRDILLISLLKCCEDVFASVVARIANLSLSEECFPSGFKMAQVSPLLKKPGLDCTDPASYQPISNLSTVSKFVERLVLIHLRPHLLASVNFNPLQSAYRTGHST